MDKNKNPASFEAGFFLLNQKVIIEIIFNIQFSIINCQLSIVN